MGRFYWDYWKNCRQWDEVILKPGGRRYVVQKAFIGYNHRGQAGKQLGIMLNDQEAGQSYDVHYYNSKKVLRLEAYD